MQRLPAWLGAGLVASGVLIGMMAGTAIAGADADSPSDAGGATSSGSVKPGAKSGTDSDADNDAVKDRPAAGGTAAKPTDRKPAEPPKVAGTRTGQTTDESADPVTSATKDVTGTVDPAPSSATAEAAAEPAESGPKKSIPSPAVVETKGTDHVATATAAPHAETPATTQPATQISRTRAAVVAPPAADTPDVATVPPMDESDVRQKVDQKVEEPSQDIAAPPVPMRASAAVEAVTAKAATPPQPTIVGVLSAVLFNLLQAVERIVTGPPVLPPNSTVTVRSSTLQVGGIDVPADWYFPAGDPPKQLILLQHGFFAIGPLYSYTAANLAEQTHSIVVAPTLTSNPLADGGFWLGGAGMHQAVADLFLGDRDALTASALAAGYAQQYGLDPEQAALPRQFALAGHSLGGALVSAVAGYLADNGAADDLAGVILLDGVPTGDQLSGALVKLAAYEARTGHYVPVRAIGAPLNIWNFASNENQSLAAARPDRFNGVVLAGGVHMDSMQGGNPLIQFVAYLAAGFPQPQNPPAVVQLAVTWLTQWFAGDTRIGDDLVPGTTLVIDTPEGPARGVVIGNPPVEAVSQARARQLIA